MYLIKTLVGEEAKRELVERPPFGPGMSAETAAKAEKVEVWGSSFHDAGEDFCEFRAIDSAGVHFAVGRVGGY